MTRIQAQALARTVRSTPGWWAGSVYPGFEPGTYEFCAIAPSRFLWRIWCLTSWHAAWTRELWAAASASEAASCFA